MPRELTENDWNLLAWTDSLDPASHCFREDNCVHHESHGDPCCCCCGQPPEAHTGCDCD